MVIQTPTGDLIEVDTKDILLGYIAELEKHNLVLDDPLERAYFFMEQYVTKILEIEVKDPFDVMRSNDVEDLSESTMWYKYMQLYTTYPIYELYKISWLEFIDQPFKDIEFQLKMAREYKGAVLAKQNNTDDEVNKLMIDENNSVDTSSLPNFKRTF